MTGDIRQSVISGVPYPVTAVAGGTVTTLDALVGDAEFTVALKGVQHVIRGRGRKLQNKVVFYEKDHIGGKDVRVWHVSVGAAGGFEAAAVAAY